MHMNIIKERREASSNSTSLDHFLKARLNNFTWCSLSFIIYKNFLKIFEKQNLEFVRLMVTKVQ